MRRIVKIYIISVAAAVAFTGCRSAKSVNQSKTENVVSASTLAQRLETYQTDYKEWTDVTLPFKIRINSPRSMSLSGRATMVRGKSIQMSVRVLGLEVAKMLLTRDHIYAMEKVKNRYVEEPMEKLRSDFPVDITNIQDLLLGKMEAVDNGKPVEMEPTVVNADTWKVDFDNLAPFLYSFLLSADNSLIEFDGTYKEKNVDVKIDYADHFATPYGTYPSSASAVVAARKKNFAAQLIWNFGSAKWNTGVDPKWVTPSGFKRISSDQLLNMISPKEP